MLLAGGKAKYFLFLFEIGKTLISLLKITKKKKLKN